MKMTLEEAIEIVDKHNRWRRGHYGRMQNPTLIGIAIDLIVKTYRDKENK
jgi:hypothetical protein